MNTEMNSNGLNSDSDVKIPDAETGEMTKWLISWRDGALNYAVFYLPKGINPTSIGWTGTLLNLVDLMAEGHEYTLKEIP